jgi:hypothetical protein
VWKFARWLWKFARHLASSVLFAQRGSVSNRAAVPKRGGKNPGTACLPCTALPALFASFDGAGGCARAFST